MSVARMNAEVHVLDYEPHMVAPSHYYRTRLRPGGHSARHVRRIVRAYVTAWGMAPLTEIAELGVTELLANVVKHVPDGTCTVILRRRAHGLRVEVHDSDPALPRPGDPEGLAEQGRGLALLDALTDAWDAERTGPATKMVWFELVSRTPAGGP
ncbi:ATP-binding protein [Streptomyces sp. RKND-216]|nr:ATP-binding protein [Streptomyces sp. RKND-216]